MKKKRPVPGRDPVRTFPYYKIQVWEPRKAVWMDIQKKFRSVDELREFAATDLDPESPTRIMIVEDYGSRRLAKNISPFPESDET